MREIKVRITFIDEVLGTSPANEDIYREYIASKNPDDALSMAELEAISQLSIDEQLEKAMTVFPKTADGTPFLWDYQIRGFFKEVCGIIKQISGTESSKVTANKKLIDNFVFVSPREILIDMHGCKCGTCGRPLRAQTPMGERVAWAISESVPEGSTVEFSVILTADGKQGKKGAAAVDYVECLKEWLDYGKLKGLMQWRNSGKGRFTYEIIE